MSQQQQSGRGATPGGDSRGAAAVPSPPLQSNQTPRQANQEHGATAASPRGEPIIVMRNVGKRFKEFRAVQGIDLAVPQGSLLGVIGPSGCGKTTTIRLLLGVYGPSEGEIRVFGEEPLRFRRATRERIGYLPQHFVLYPTLSVDENLDFAAAVFGLGPVKRRKYKEQALQFVGLAEHRHTLAGDISGGMQRRLELAATLLHQPELLVLDEPTAGIDPILREQFWAEFRRLQRAGRTQIVTTQYVTEAEYCDVVILMDAGSIVAAGAPDDLRREAAGGNLIDASIANLDDRTIETLRAIPGVQAVRRLGDTEVRLVTAGQAGELIPQVAAALERNNAQAQTIEERRLSFNEVFVALLERAGRDVSQIAESRGGRNNGR